MLVSKNLFVSAWVQVGLKKEFAKKLQEMYPDLEIGFEIFATLKQAIATYKTEQIGRSLVTKKRLVPELWVKIRFLDNIVATFFRTEQELLLEIITNLMLQNFPQLEIDIKII